MRQRLLRIAIRLWPALASADDTTQARGVSRVATLLVAGPLALAGLVWLTAVTDWRFLSTQWPLLLLFLVLRIWLAQLDFAGILDTDLLPARGSQGRLVIWSAALLFGPTVLWVEVVAALFIEGVYRRRNWGWNTHLVLPWARELLPALVALWLYERWGGVLPLPGLTLTAVLPALYASLVKMGVFVLIAIPLFIIDLYAPRRLTLAALVQKLGRFWLTLLIFYLLPEPFAVLASGLFVQSGLWAYLFFITGVFLFSLLANRLSKTAVFNQQRARELAQLEQLARAMLNEPLDHFNLSELLAEYVPAILREGQIEIRLFPQEVLYRSPAIPETERPEVGQAAVPEGIWTQLQHTTEPYLVWRSDSRQENGPGIEALLVSITTVADERKGGICALAQDPTGVVVAWLPVLHSLAAQIAAALNRLAQYEQAFASQAAAYQEEVYAQAYQAEVYAQTLAYQQMTQELELAGQIQASFLPQDLPEVAGWQLAVTLEPARQTSGDYYDFIPLPDGRLGLLVADVADKGMGAALYMALSRTLIRTYAEEYNAEPEKVLAAANRRILADTVSDLFVTVFYAVLEPQTGVLTYCNAGHNPPFLVQAQNGNHAHALVRTALPLGILADMDWGYGAVEIQPGDVLILYTDGITEAQDEAEDFFGEERLKAVARASMGRSAEVIEGKLISAVYDFVGDAPQFDDITLMIVLREPL